MNDMLNNEFVAFIGAGASSIPPSHLPSWTEFNNFLLESLGERLAEYSRNRQPTDIILAKFRQRRDLTPFFAPDFQAQLIEEEIGADYFRVWQSLETDVYGPVHDGLAQLASQGRLAAIITTNFDRLIETALKARNQAFEVFHNAAAFEVLAQRDGEITGVLPIVKLHGSIEDTTSLVDTLKQRMVGRPTPLMKVLRKLLNYPWLYLGFSGRDFSYNRHYLGILDAAAEAKGFVFLARKNNKIEPGVRALAKAYGKEKSVIERGDLASWLSQTFALTTAPLVSNRENIVPADRVQDGIKNWVAQLRSMAVINVFCSMLRSSGMDAEALWLMRRTWKSYRSDEDTQGPSYGRFNYNFGLALFEKGFLRNSVSLNEDLSNMLEWREQADQNGYEYLARSYHFGHLPGAAQLGTLLAYRGEVRKAMGVIAEITDKAMKSDQKLDWCEVALASVPVYDIVRMFTDCLPQVFRCLQVARELGDEPRRAMASAHLGRFLTYNGAIKDADSFITDAEETGDRLGLGPVRIVSKAARGRWFADSGKSDEQAVKILSGVASDIRLLDEEPLFAKLDPLKPETQPAVIRGTNPFLCRVLLDLNRAARFGSNVRMMEKTLDELDGITASFLGYRPHFLLSYVECIGVDPNQRELAVNLLANARELGELSGNPSTGKYADELEQVFSLKN